MSEREQLYRLAKERGLDPHSRHGVPKLREMLTEAGVKIGDVRPNAVADAEATRKAEALELAHEAGINVDESWSSDRIEKAVEDALEAADNAPEPEPQAPQGEIDVDDPIRKEILSEAQKVGMNLHELEDKDNDTVLALIGAHMSEQTLRKSEAQENAGKVTVRVTKKGDNKISKGIHVPGVGDLKHSKGTELLIGLQVARELEDRGFVEIQDA
jgi:hypothetical protein